MKTLIEYFRTQPENEVQEVLRILRSSTDLVSVIRLVKESNVLLAATGDPAGSPSGESEQAQLDELDSQALARSTIRVPARPWTAVAGDGLVSELVSSFFAVDHPHVYSFVDRDCFIADMRSQNPKDAKYCSPFLVNAICAFRCVSHLFLMPSVTLVHLPHPVFCSARSLNYSQVSHGGIETICQDPQPRCWHIFLQ